LQYAQHSTVTLISGSCQTLSVVVRMLDALIIVADVVAGKPVRRVFGVWHRKTYALWHCQCRFHSLYTKLIVTFCLILLWLLFRVRVAGWQQSCT